HLTSSLLLYLFSLHHTAPTQTYTLSLHDALPISGVQAAATINPLVPGLLREIGIELGPKKPRLVTPEMTARATRVVTKRGFFGRSEEHTSELQSRGHLVCRLLLEKKKQSRVSRSE